MDFMRAIFAVSDSCRTEHRSDPPTYTREREAGGKFPSREPNTRFGPAIH